jgi:hypothetical protein
MSPAFAFFEPTDSEDIEHLYKKDIREGERKLMLAVLENAIEDFQKHVLAGDHRGKGLFQDAEGWIMEKNSPSFFSFENICAHLDLDPGYIRRGFVRWKALKQKAR